MGRIKAKRTVEPPEAVKAVVEKVLAQPLDQVGESLEGFTWDFEKGDLHHWVPLLDHFDAFFEVHLKDRADLRLELAGEDGREGTSSASAAPLPTANLLAILRVTAVILEHSGNKSLYNSTDYLSLLLAAPDTRLVLAALHTLVSFVRKGSHSSTLRWAAKEELSARLRALAQGWGLRDEGLGMVDCACGREQGVQVPPALHLEYYEDPAQQAQQQGSGQPQQSDRPGAADMSPQPAAAATDVAGEGVSNLAAEPAAGLRVVTIPTGGDLEVQALFRQLLQQHKVPPKHRFQLLQKVRLAQGLCSVGGRQDLVRMRLMAFSITVQSNPAPSDLLYLFQSDPEFVSQLAALLRTAGEAQVQGGILPPPLEIQALALRALAIQLMDRSRHPGVVSAVASGGQSGLLAALLHRGVVGLDAEGQGGSGEGGGFLFMEALLSLVGALVSSTTGTQTLSDAGLVPALLPMLRDTHPRHLPLVASSVRILEAFMDFSPPSATLFRELGGLTQMVDRLKLEVGLEEAPPAPPPSPSSATAAQAMAAEQQGVGSAQAAQQAQQQGVGSAQAAQQAQQQGVGSAQAAQQAQQQGVGSAQAAQQAQQQGPFPGDAMFGRPTVPYNRRLLLKSLMRAISMASYTTGSSARPSDADSAALYACLRTIFARSHDFGGGLFALAASVVTDLIHHDPLIYRSLDEAGLPEAFLASVGRCLLPSMDAVAAVPNTMVALCLNEGGLRRVRESQALYCLATVFTSKHYLRALQGEAASMLGSSLDELLRHVPRLRQEGVDMALQILRRLCILGGDPTPPQPAPIPPPDPPRTQEAEAGGEGGAGEAGAAAAVTAAEGQEAGERAAAEGEAMDTDARSVEEMEVERPPGSAAASAHQLTQQAAPTAAPPPHDADMGSAQHEGEQGQQQAQHEEAPAPVQQPVVSLPLDDADVASVPAGEAESYLVECVTYTARMLEQMLASTETARVFVERGGVELLLALYRLPRLPASFGSTNASHSLLVAFRVFTAGQSAQTAKIFGLLRTALLKQLEVALEAARAVGGSSVPLLPPAERERYVREVCSAEGLAALAAAVVRNASSTLKEVSNGDMSVILKLGELERHVLWQAAVAEEWKLQHAQQEATAAAGAQQQGPGGDLEMQEAAGGQPVAATDGAAAATAEGDRPGDDLAGGGTGAKKRKSPQELCLDILLHFSATARAFYQSVAKAIHVPAGRRRDEPSGQATMSMKAAAVNLAVVIRKNLEFEADDPEAKGKAAVLDPADAAAMYASHAARRVRYTQRVLDTCFHVLYDARRRSCHTLVYNYWVACGGLRALVRTFPQALDLLRKLPPPPPPKATAASGERGKEKAEGGGAQAGEAQQAQHGDADMADHSARAEGSRQPTAATAAAAVPGAHGEGEGSIEDAGAAYRRSLEQLLSTSLVFMTNLSYVNMVANSPNSATFITAPVPGSGGEEGQEARVAEDLPAFMRRVWGVLLATVLPLWRDADLLAAYPKMVQPLVSVLRNCMESPQQMTAAAGAAARAAAGSGASRRVPNPAIVRHLEEMGFPRARAEEALRQVGNSVELAMEWLISYPEPAEGDEGAAGGAGGSGSAEGAAQQGQKVPQEDEALASMVADTLSVEGERMAMLQEANADAASASMPDSVALVDGCVTLTERSPSAAFWLCDLLKAHSALSAANRQSVLARLMWHLSGRQAPSDAQLLAPAQLLTVLVNEAGPCREVASEKGLSSVALDAIEAWVIAHLPHQPNPQGPASPKAQPKMSHPTPSSTDPIPVPTWVDALLLALDVMANTQPKPAAAASADAAADAAESQQPEAGPATEANAGAGVATSAPGPADSTVTVVRGASAEQPSTAGGAGTTAASPAGPAPQALAAEAGAPDPPAAPCDPLQKVLAAVGSQWHVGGLLSDQEQVRATALCLTLLRHLHAHGASWVPADGPAANPALTPDPASTLHAVLQLLARLTKRHDVALKFLGVRGPALLLDLPPTLYQPQLEPYMAALMRHCLEDPATLQAAMEAEIRSTLAEKGRTGSQYRLGRDHDTSMQLRTFLSTLAPVAARAPDVFVEAVRATCSLSEAGALMAGRRVMISLKKKSEGGDAAPAPTAVAKTPSHAAPAGVRTPGPAPPVEQQAAGGTPAQDGQGQQQQPSPADGAAAGKLPGATPGPAPKSAGKPTKKVPTSFLEVIDPLVDVLLRYNGPQTPPARPANTTAATSGEQGASRGRDGATAAPQAALPGAGAGAGGPSRVQVINRRDGSVEVLVNHSEGEGEEQGRGLSRDQRDVAVQCFALKLLSDFTLMYQNCVGVLLKRDSDLTHKEATLRRITASKRADRATPGLLRHLCDVHLTLGADKLPAGSVQSMAAQASTVLLAICIRSPEGRRRIVAHMVAGLTGGEGIGAAKRGDGATPAPPAPPVATPAAAANTPYVAKSGRPPPFQIKSFVDLASFLLSTSSMNSRGAGASGGRAQAGGLSTEIVRAMKEGGMVTALTQALQQVDLDHPDAVKSIHAILRPLEILTRAWPKRVAGGAAGGGAGEAAATGEGQLGGEGQPGAAATGARSAAGAAGGVDSGEAEAGPQALAAAGQALVAVDRRRARREQREMDDMMEALFHAEFEGEEGGDGFRESGSESDEEMGGYSDDDQDEDDEGEEDDSEDEDGSEMEESDSEEGSDIDVDDVLGSGSSDEEGSSLDEDDDDEEGHLQAVLEFGRGGAENMEDDDEEESDIGEELDEEEEDEDDDIEAAEEAAMIAAAEGRGPAINEDDEGLLGEEDGLGVPRVGAFPGELLALERGVNRMGGRRARELPGGDEDVEDDGWIVDDYDDEEEDYEEDDYEDDYPGDDEFGGEGDEEAAAALREPTDILETLEEIGARRRLPSLTMHRSTGSGPVAGAGPPPPAQHPLLTRPTSAQGGQASTTAGGAGPRGGALNAFFTRGLGLSAGDMEVMQEALAPLGLNPEMLFGSGRFLSGPQGARLLAGPAGGRGLEEAVAAGGGSRGANWTDGDAAGAGTFSSLAQTLERALADNLMEGRAGAEQQQPSRAAGEGEGEQQHPAAALLEGLGLQGEGAARATPELAAQEAQQEGEPPSAPAPATAAAPASVMPAQEQGTAATPRSEEEGAAAADDAQPAPVQPASAATTAAAGGAGISANAFQEALQAALRASGPAGRSAEGQQQQQQAAAPLPPTQPQVDAGGDVEMGEAHAEPPQRPATQEREAAVAGEEGPAPLDPALRRAADEAGIDLPFLEALPPELRAEVLGSAGVTVPPPQPAPATLEQQPEAPAAPGAAPAGTPAPAVDSPPAGEEAATAAAAPAPAPAPASGGGGEDEEMEGIDPEFLAALPPDLQAEVLEQQRMQRRMREAQRRREEERRAAAEARAAAGGDAAAPPGGPVDLDFASLLATFPPEVREDVLMTAEESMLRTLPPALLAEAQALRDRVGRMGAARGFAGRGGIPEPPPLEAGAVAQMVPAGGLRTGDQVMVRVSMGSDGRVLPRLELLSRRVDDLEARLSELRRLGGELGASVGTAERRAGGKRGGAGEVVLEPPPEVDEKALLTLVRLLKLSQPIGKGQLQRLFHNLCANSSTRASLLRILVSMLRAPLSADEAAGGPGAQLPADASDVIRGSALGQNSAVVALGLAKPYEGGSVPPLVTRRVLEVLSYLCRHHGKVPQGLVELQVPTLDHLAAQLAAQRDVKGKAKVGDASQDQGEGALPILLAVPSRPLCRRSDSHQQQALELLSYLLRPFEDKEYERGEKRKKEKELAAVREAADAVAASAATAVAEREEAQAGGGGAASTAAMQTDDVAQQAQQAPSPAPLEPSAQQAQQLADGAGAAAEAGTSAAGGSVAGQGVDEAGGGSGSGQAEKGKEGEGEEAYRVQKGVFAALPEQLLRSLPQLLADEVLSDKASTLLKMVIQGLNLVTPPQLPISLGELRSVLSTLSTRADKGLEALASADVAGGSALLSSDVARVGRLMLRCVTCLWENAGQMVREAPKREAPQEEVDACRSVVLGTLGELQHALDPLWRHLSMVAGQVEGVLRASKGNEATKVLPPGAAQLQPLVECLFILGDVRNQLEAKQDAAPGATPALEPSPSLPGPSSPRLSSGASGSLQQGEQPWQQAAGAQADGQAAALRFAEHHRRLVNALVHAHPGLLTTSMQLLMKMPRLLDFDNKRAFFRTKVKELGGSLHYGSVRISVRRDHVFEDSFYQLRMRTPGEMKGKLNVTFQGEEGVDAGGVTREWFQVMSREMFNPQFSLFQAVPEGGTTFQPNPNSIIQNDEARGTNHLDFFKFVGRVVGKALHDGQYIDAHFTRSFYKHLLGQPLNYGDIEAVDPDFYKNLAWMLENDITDVLDLTFCEEEDFFGRKQTVELKPGGAHIKVTNENKREYVDLVARHRMTTAIKEQIDSFQRGFWDVVPQDLITMFTDHEIELLISGLPEIDVDDLRANTEYAGYSSTSPVVRWFWDLVREMDKQDLALLVQFVTGTSKVPLDGFKALQGVHGPQRFSIHKAYGAKVRLPSAHTCFNQLDLIEYDSKEQLRERLMTAIHEGSEGFGFA